MSATKCEMCGAEFPSGALPAFVPHACRSEGGDTEADAIAAEARTGAISATYQAYEKADLPQSPAPFTEGEWS